MPIVFITLCIGACTVKDITNTVLTNRSPSCEDYYGKYCAKIRDAHGNDKFTAELEIDDGGSKCSFETNSIPNHDVNAGKFTFANAIGPVTRTVEITKAPTRAASVTELSLLSFDAILLNGALVDLLADGCCGVGDGKTGCGPAVTEWRKDPGSLVSDLVLDGHLAHTQPDGTYHYHGDPIALYDRTGTVVSPVIGFAADGFPIYGPFINDGGIIRKVRSSWLLRSGPRPVGSCPGGVYDGTYIDDFRYAPGSGDLDRCNGMTLPSGKYAYFVTDTYPHILGCFSGTPDASFEK